MFKNQNNKTPSVKSIIDKDGDNGKSRSEKQKDIEIAKRVVSKASQLGFTIHPEQFILAATELEEDSFDAPDWQAFNPIHNADEIVAELKNIPEPWELTPLRDKRPYLKNWQDEKTLARDFIEKAILEGELKTSKKTGRPFKLYASGFGLKTGDISDGILAIDVDGSSAQPVLKKLSNGELPETISWKSGKPGRYQIAFQIPEEHREAVNKFTRAVVNQTDDLKCNPGEQLEFRYNRMQSCLPPSRHPETGSYQWINSPEDIEIAIAPQWLLELLPKLVAKEQEESSKKQKNKKQYDGSYAVGFSGDDNPYDARNLIQYCEGYREKNNDWLEARCPVHKGVSTTSLTVNRHNGKFQCFNDCCNKDIYKSLIELAKINGVVFPARANDNQKSKQKSPEQIAQDNAQFEAEKIIHGQLEGIDFEKTTQQGITITRINKEKLSPEDLNLEKGKISIVLSAKGTGKTEGLQPYMPHYKAVYSWHTRVTLAIKMAYDLGLTYKSKIDNFLLSTKASFCANSAYKFHPKVLQDNAFLLFDECDQIFDYTFDSLCNKDGIRPLILATHKAQLVATLTNGSAAYMSADISQKEIDYISAIAPANAKIELIVNDYKPKKGKLKFSTDGKPDSVIKKLLADLDNAIPCFLLDDFKNGYRGCKTIAEFIRKKRPDLAPYIVEINGDTSEQEEIKNYVERINENSINTMLLSCSPSIISGISLTNGRFNKGVYGIINGILTPNNGSQGFARVRGAENINVWVANSGINYEASRAITPSEVDKYYQDNYHARNKILLTYQPEYNPMKQEWHSPHWQLFCQNSALKNLEMRRLRYWYQQKLIDDGYELIETNFGIDASGIGDSLKEIAGELKLEEIVQISDAKDLSFHEVQQLSNKSNSGENLTLEERQQLTKHHLKDTFGDELISEAKTTIPTGEELSGLKAIAFMNHRNGLENSMKRFYRNFHQETADIASSDTYIENRQQKLRPDIAECNKRFPKDIKWQLRERKLWEFLEFQSYLDPTREYYPEDYQPLINKVRKYIEPIKQATGYNFEKASDGQIIAYLHGMNGLRLEVKQKRVNNKVIKVKTITSESWSFAQKFVARQVERKLGFEGVTHPPILLVNGILTGGCVTAEKTIPSNTPSHFEAPLTANPLTGDLGGGVTAKSEQLTLDLGDWTEYYLIHNKERDICNDNHDIYSYEDGD
ncbi:MAG: bifunctional DNA primase/polymerase [Nostoc sp. NMS7]|uniref:plasmid replication protein, CyRepA1 family n=1 Tax=Nostoc sp. NMS7 TaxID=2815391 RepID=UPI0025F93F3F|nr:plasmid replication protein, CyRepA1 family [Nostoc sp. NMS7]MBN3945274.1 bifunctional DNA primase/polymerase [Nostoc sp. NMS7]